MSALPMRGDDELQSCRSRFLLRLLHSSGTGTAQGAHLSVGSWIAACQAGQNAQGFFSQVHTIFPSATLHAIGQNAVIQDATLATIALAIEGARPATAILAHKCITTVRRHFANLRLGHIHEHSLPLVRFSRMKAIRRHSYELRVGRLTVLHRLGRRRWH